MTTPRGFTEARPSVISGSEGRLKRAFLQSSICWGLSQPFWASLYVRAYAPLDFHVDVPSEAEAAADTGELEMF